jgi:parvulin-like peptidyl-prolyl isomerase
MIRRPLLAALLAAVPVAAAPSPPAVAAAPAAEAAAPQTFAFLRAPLFAEEFAEFPVARVEGEVVTFRDLNAALVEAHGARKGEEQAGRTDVLPIVDRLVDARLLVLEARNMGFDELPETKEALDAFREATGMELLKAQVTKDVVPDPAEVKGLYEERVREWKVRSLLFANESDAIRTRAEVDAGKRLEELTAALVAEGKAKGGGEAQILPRAQVVPAVVAILDAMKAGETSRPVKLEDGWALLTVEEIRHPEDPKVRAEVEKISVSRLQGEALKKYYAGLVKRYARVDRALLKSLDFEAKKPGAAALKKDRRVVAHIQGGKPIRVAELAEALLGGFYHGAEGALERKRVNRKKMDVFDGLLSKRIVPLEVKRLGIDRSPELARQVAERERSILFGRLLAQVIVPQVKVEEAAVLAHYEKNRAEYTYPAFYKLESLAFANVKDAQAAVDKLRSGTDFKWLNANAGGQVPPPERKVRLEGTLSASSLPKDLADVLSGARAGDHRLYAGPASQFYAVHVVDVVSPREQPLEEVRGKIEESIFYEGLNAAVKDWAGKLRKATDVQVFITRIGS